MTQQLNLDVHEGRSSNERETGRGVVEELARDDVGRKKFLKTAGRGIGSAAAASGLAAFIAACGSSTAQPKTTSTPTTGSSTGASNSASGDLAIVNYALTLEYLESMFYRKVEAAHLFSGKTLAILEEFGGEEDQHVSALHKVAASLGTPVTPPKTQFPLHTAGQVAELAATVENLGAAAYLGQAGRIQSKEILAAALSIHTIEGRHAATLNLLVKRDPTPQGAFAKPMTMAQVLPIVKPFIV